MGDIRQRVEEYLEKGKTLTLALVAEGNRPMAATVVYVSEGLNLYFVTDARTQKAQCIGEGAAAAVTVDEYRDDWSTIQGVQMEGTVAPLKDEARMREVLRVFGEKFPQVQKLMPELPPTFQFYEFVPVKVWFIDYTRGFGHRDYFEV
jgi:hypothetical protein